MHLQTNALWYPYATIIDAISCELFQFLDRLQAFQRNHC